MYTTIQHEPHHCLSFTNEMYLTLCIFWTHKTTFHHSCAQDTMVENPPRAD